MGARRGRAGRGATGPHAGTTLPPAQCCPRVYLFFFSIVPGCRTVTPAPSAGPCREDTHREGADRSCARPVMLNLEKHTFLLDLLIGHTLCERPPAASSHYTHTRRKSKGRDFKAYAPHFSVNYKTHKQCHNI